MKLGNYHEGFVARHFGRNKSEIWVWGTKIYDATDFQPTAQQDKLCLNPLPLLLIDHKYIHEVGKLSRRFFPAAFWAK